MIELLAESISFASLSSRKSTADLEEVVVIGKWTLLLLGAWTGALNQRHTAANSVLGVARGKLPIFAYIYTAVIIALPSVATAISFPLFGCELGSSGSNLLVCGDDASSATAGRVLGGICFFLNILAVVFSLFAAYRLQKVPRSDSQATAIFNKSKELRVAQLARELNQTDRARSGEAPAAAPVPVAASYVAIGQDRLPLLSVRP